MLQTRISAILAGTRAITVDTGLRLDRYFGLSEGWWGRLQTDCDLRKAHRELSARIAREVKPREFAVAWDALAAASIARFGQFPVMLRNLIRRHVPGSMLRPINIRLRPHARIRIQ